MGPSGSGKSTLMNIIAAWTAPRPVAISSTASTVEGLSDNELAAIRLRKLASCSGFNLLARTDALKNVPPSRSSMPTSHQGPKPAPQAALAEGRLADRSHHQPNQLSGASSSASPSHAPSSTTRRAARRRATGNLDSKTSAELMALFANLHEGGRTIIMVTHDREVRAPAKRVIRLLDGLVVSDGPPTLRNLPGLRPARHHL